MNSPKGSGALRVRIETIHNIVNAGGRKALALTYAAFPQLYLIGGQEPITYLPVRPIVRALARTELS